jgi:type II secretory pathway component GspD/PulD (secretin)
MSLFQVLFLVLFHSTGLASVSLAQDVLNQELSVDFKNVPLREALTQLSQQASVKFVFSSSHIHAKKRVNLVATQQKLNVILSQLLSPMAIEFTLTSSILW